MKGRRFSRFESAAQRLIEGVFGRVFGGKLELDNIAALLGHALEDSRLAGQVANVFTIHIHPSDQEALLAEVPNLIERLTQYLVQFGPQIGLTLHERPTIRLQPDDEMAFGEAFVDAKYDVARDAATQQYDFGTLDQAVEMKRAIREVDAFLIIDGRRHIGLDEPIITIGRQIDNTVVLESPSVSRKHAQIRWRYNRFVLFDLGSRLGTKVNGEVVTEHALHPGDVINLADIPLIYGEGYTQHRRKEGEAVAQSTSGTLALSRDVLDNMLNEKEE